jgi:hypothetical protein
MVYSACVPLHNTQVVVFNKKAGDASVLKYQPPASTTFLSEQTSHQQPASSIFFSE